MRHPHRSLSVIVLMDANARTGRREKGQVGSKDNNIIGGYGRETLNDNGELLILLSFDNNHNLPSPSAREQVL